MAEELLPKFPFRSASVAATGATNATLLAAPPDGEAYIIRNIYGVNDAGANRRLNFGIKKVATETLLWSSTSVVNGAMFTPRAAGGQPSDFSIVLSATDESFRVSLSAAGTPTIYALYEVVESMRFKSTSVALTGTTHATLLAAPPFGVSYRVFRVFGVNGVLGNRALTLHLNKATVATPLYLGPTAGFFINHINPATDVPVSFEIFLSDTDESLEVDSSGTGTDRVFCFYEVLES